MVRTVDLRPLSAQRSPHPRGDGPVVGYFVEGDSVFSPPAWGWSEERILIPRGEHVLPTRVGMVRQFALNLNTRIRSPHPRGDGPISLQSWRRSMNSLNNLDGYENT